MTLRKKLARYIILTSMVIFGCASHIRSLPDFNQESILQESFAVLPPEIDFYFKHTNREEPSPELGKETEKLVQLAVEEVLAKKDIEVLGSFYVDSLLSANQNLALSLESIKQSFADAATFISSLKETDSISVTLGAGLEQLANGIQVDHFVFIRGSGRRGPVRRISIGPGDYELDGLNLEIAIVDARSAEILWFNRNSKADSGYDPLHFKSVRRLCRKLLKDIEKS